MRFSETGKVICTDPSNGGTIVLGEQARNRELWYRATCLGASVLDPKLEQWALPLWLSTTDHVKLGIYIVDDIV